MNHIYCFASFRLNVAERQLVNGEEMVPLTPKAFDVLVHLVRNAGHLVGKDELMDAVWTDSFVEPNNLPRTVHILRTALGQAENGSGYIETVPKKGYRFVAEVSVRLPEDPVAHAAASGGAISDLATPNRFSKRKLLYLTSVLIIFSALSTGWYAGMFRSAETPAHSRGEQSQNGQAYNHYRQGRLLIDRKLANDREAALAEFEKAIALDPKYAAAYAGKADVKLAKFWGSGAHDDVVQSRAASAKAIDLDPRSAYAYTILCRIKYTYDWDLTAAEKDCRKAIEIDPSSPDAHHELAMGLVSTGRGSEAEAEIDIAIALSPTSYYKGQKGIILYFLRRYDEAIEQLEHIRSTDPQFRHGVHRLVHAYEAKKDYNSAFRVYLAIGRGAGDDSPRLKNIYAAEGWPGIMRDMIERSPDTNASPPQTAAMYCQLRDKERAFELLAKGFNQRSLWMAHILMEPRLDPCRDDPRFEEFLKKVYGT